VGRGAAAHAGGRLLQGEHDVDDRVATAPAGRPGARAGLEPAPEEGVDEVGQVAEPGERVPADAAGPAGVAVAVVVGARLRVLQHLVGGRQLLERLGIAPRVRVQLPGLAPVGALDLVLAGVVPDAEDLVEVSHCSGCPTGR
jgi:hypothetical protein